MSLPASGGSRASWPRHPPPAYGFAYIEALDTLLHKIGSLEPERTGVDAEVRHLLSGIETELLDALPAGTLLLLSADHGMTPVSPRATINLNVGEHAAEIVSHVRTGAEPGPLARACWLVPRPLPPRKARTRRAACRRAERAARPAGGGASHA